MFKSRNYAFTYVGIYYEYSTVVPVGRLLMVDDKSYFYGVYFVRIL